MKLRIFGFLQKSSEIFRIFQISKGRFIEHQIAQLCLLLTDLLSYSFRDPNGEHRIWDTYRVQASQLIQIKI